MSATDSRDEVVGRVAADPTVAKDTSVVALLTLLSRVTGFARVVAIAAVLGVNRFSDLYQSVNLLPNFAHELLTGSLVTAILVPPLVRYCDEKDLLATGRLAGGFLTLIVGAATVLTVVVISVGSLVIRLLTLGVTDPGEQESLVRLGWPLLILLMPQVILYSTAAVGAAVQNASGRFGLAAAAPLVENIVILVVIGLWAGLFGVGVESVAGVATNQVLFLGIGTTAAVFLHALLQWFGAARCGVLIRPRRGWRDPEVREVVRLARPAVAYTALNVVRVGVFVVGSGLVTGGQTAFLIALNFFNLPVALTAKPVATTAIPALARLRESTERFTDRYLSALRLVLFLAIPAAGMMTGLARPIAIVGLWGTASTAEATALLAGAIAAVALAIPGESVFLFSTNASYARRDARSPLFAMMLRAGIGTVIAGVVALAHRAGHGVDWQVIAAFAAAMALADAIGAWYLANRIAAGANGLARSLTGRLPLGLATLAVGVGSATASESLFGPTRLMAVVAIGVGGLVGMALVAGSAATTGRSVLRDYAGRGNPFGPIADRRPRWLRWPRRLRWLRWLRRPSWLRWPRRLRWPSWLRWPRRLRWLRRPRRARDRREAPIVQRMRSVIVVDLGPRTIVRVRTIVMVVISAMFVAAAPFAGWATAEVDVLVPGIVVSLFLVGIVVWRPVSGPLVLLGTTPLIVGLVRGSIIPFIRLNEAVLLVIVVGLGLHVLRRWSRAERAGLAAGGLSTLDLAVTLIVLAGSVVPVLIRFGRSRSISVDDLTHAVVFAKFGLTYLVFRYGVRTAADVRRCMIVSITAAVPVALLAVAQSMQVPGVGELLRPWLDGPPEIFVGRGAATVGNSGALGDLMAVHLAIALMLFFGIERITPDDGRLRRRARGLTLTLIGVFAVGGLGSGQFAGFAATAIAVVVVIVVAGRPRALLGVPILGAAVVAALWPVVSRRLDGFDNAVGLPLSWQVRIENLTQVVQPVLMRDFNWALGVRPNTTIDTQEAFGRDTFIESGYLWLLWAGGLALLAGFIALMVVAFVQFRFAARSDDLWVRAAGGAGLAATTFVVILMTIDPHITLRGFADVYFGLLAVSLIAGNAPALRRAMSRGEHLFRMPRVGWFRYSYVSSGSKRLFDVFLSVVLLIVLSPVLLIIAVLVRRTSPGPALFRQRRVGFAERPFTMLKFRTMRVDGDDGEHRDYVRAMLLDEAGAGNATDGRPDAFKLVDDRRITPVGRLLRRTSLDELPQLINVLRGEMSLVGPRPSLAYEVADYERQHRIRATSLPGMTGLWQVSGRNDLHMREALDLDIRYIESCSLRLDLSILVRTVAVVARRSGV